MISNLSCLLGHKRENVKCSCLLHTQRYVIVGMLHLTLINPPYFLKEEMQAKQYFCEEKSVIKEEDTLFLDLIDQLTSQYTFVEFVGFHKKAYNMKQVVTHRRSFTSFSLLFCKIISTYILILNVKILMDFREYKYSFERAILWEQYPFK